MVLYRQCIALTRILEMSWLDLLQTVRSGGCLVVLACHHYPSLSGENELVILCHPCESVQILETACSLLELLEISVWQFPLLPGIL